MSADLAIRLRRAAFNRALADADLAAIGPLLSVDAVLVTGTDSAVLTGRKAQLAAWKREFAALKRTIYTHPRHDRRLPRRADRARTRPLGGRHRQRDRSVGKLHREVAQGRRRVAN